MLPNCFRIVSRQFHLYKLGKAQPAMPLLLLGFWLMAQPVVAQLPVRAFRNLDLTGAFTVYLTKAVQSAVRVEGPASRTQKIAVESQNDLLTIHEDSVAYGDAGQVRIYISGPQLNTMRLKGRVTVAQTTGFSTLTVTIPDDSRISMAADLDNVLVRSEQGGFFRLTGVLNKTTVIASYGGRVELSGQGKQLRAELYEGGRLNAFGFICQRANLTVQVSSQANVTVTDSLMARSDLRSLVAVKGSADVTKQFYRNDKLLIQTAYRFLGASELTEADYFFRLATQRFPSAWRAYEGLGEVYRARNQPDSAQVMLNQAQTINRSEYMNAADYSRKGFRRATVRQARNTEGKTLATCQAYTLTIDGIFLPVCVGDNLPESYRNDGQDVWVKFTETKLGELIDRGHRVVMNDCCGLIIRLLDIQTRTEL